MRDGDSLKFSQTTKSKRMCDVQKNKKPNNLLNLNQTINILTLLEKPKFNFTNISFVLKYMFTFLYLQLRFVFYKRHLTLYGVMHRVKKFFYNVELKGFTFIFLIVK